MINIIVRSDLPFSNVSTIYLLIYNNTQFSDTSILLPIIINSTVHKSFSTVNLCILKY